MKSSDSDPDPLKKVTKADSGGKYIFIVISIYFLDDSKQKNSKFFERILESSKTWKKLEKKIIFSLYPQDPDPVFGSDPDPLKKTDSKHWWKVPSWY